MATTLQLAVELVFLQCVQRWGRGWGLACSQYSVGVACPAGWLGARFKPEVCVEKQAKKIGSADLVDRLVAEIVPSQLCLCGSV